MNAIWSFWSKPYYSHYNTAWQSSRHHYLSWILSLERSKKHFDQTHLYTDDFGKKMLVEGLGLQFDYVSTQLNELKDRDPEFWVLGKLYTYHYQKAPFMHIDNDVFLWKPLPALIRNVSLFFQNPEYFHFDGSDSYYQPAFIENAIVEAGGWLPEEWKWYTEHKIGKGVCVGIIGGNNIEFIDYYAQQAIRMIEDPANRNAWKIVRERYGHRLTGHNLLFEQYLLSAMIDYHKQDGGSKFNDLNIRYLFNSFEDAMMPQNARNAGYTHLIGPAKRNKALMDKLEERVKKDYSSLYRNCLQLIN